MKIPKKIKIAGYKYDVRFAKNRAEETGSDNPASCVFRYQKIFIDNEQHKEEQESSFIHEILEAINYHYQLGLSHEKISTLETALFQVLNDNKLLK